MLQPSAHRPRVPAGYGVESATEAPGTRLPWSTVHDRLLAARTYWVGTTRPDGRPHAVPVWAVWLDGALYFSTGATTATARNLAANPHALAHPDDGERVAIVEGAAVPVTERAVLERVAADYERKYDYAMDPDVLPGPVYALLPEHVLSWDSVDSLGETMTRWDFQDRPADSCA